MAEKNTTTKSESAETPNTPPSGGKGAAVVVGIVVLLALVGGGWYLTQVAPKENNENTPSEAANMEPNEPVARVNGQEIIYKDYQERVKEVANAATAQGLDPTDETLAAQISDQAITALINSQILLQNSIEAGITVSDEQIEESYQRAADQLGGEEALQSALQELGFTEEELRADIKEQLLIDAYVQSETDYQNFTASDEEIDSYYAEVSEGNEEVPPLEEVRDLISSQILTEKQQAAINELVQSLRAEAEIEILI